MVGVILHLCKPQKYSFLQSITSVEMYRSGCNQKVFNNVLLVLCLLLQFIKSYLYKSNENKCGLQILRWFQKLGLCKGVKGTRISVDKLCSEYDSNIKSWKNDIQV